MKRFLLLAAVLLAGISANAEPVDLQKAKDIAKTFFAEKGVSFNEAQVAFKAPRKAAKNNEANYYVFNADNNNGFVIVSGDDRAAQILGYSTTGSFNESELSENMRSWMQYYSDRIQYICDKNIEVTHETAERRAARKASKAHHSIAPILTCNWNQGDPYNQQCPEYYNEDGSIGGRSATGCVATAIAQVLYFHKYPAVTKGRIPSQVCRWNLNDGTSKTYTMPAIKAGTEIDWDNMCDNYYGNETQEQKDAVAFLMKLVGQSLKMGYGASSGSSYAESRKLFVDYLGYDDGVRILRSDNYGITEWFEMMYDELDKGYPIGYGGSSTGGGHAFVVDGFDGDEFFHLNWGWGGGSNGYFRIDVLNPGDNSGIGASSSADGYSMGQDAIMYLRGFDNGIDEGFEADTHASINDTRIDGTKIFSNYVNWTGATNSFNCAIVMKDENGELVPVSNIQTISNLGANYYQGITFDMKGRFSQPGEYHISPANKLTANKTYRPLYNLKNEYIKAIVDENLNVTLEHYSEPIALEVAEWTFPGTLKAGDQQDVIVNLKNNGGEFKRELALYASMTDDKGGSVSRALIGVKSGDSDDFTFFFKPATAGTYNLWLTLNSDRNKVIGQTTVVIGNVAKNKPNLSVSSVNISNAAYGNFLKGTMTVKNNAQTEYKGVVKIQFWHLDGAWWSGSSQSLYYDIAPGGTGTADFCFDNLRIGDTYRFSQNYGIGGELGNGGVFAGNEYTLKKGALAYSKLGTTTGTNVSTSFTAAKSGAAVRFYGVTPNNVTASENTNFVYVFEPGSSVPSSLDGLNVVVGNEAEVLNLDADKDTYFPESFTAKSATFTYTPAVSGDGNGNWVPLTLPFKPTSITVDGKEITWSKGDVVGSFLIKEFTEVNDNLDVVFDDAEELNGGTPYLISVPAELVGKTIVFSANDVTVKSLANDNMLVGSSEFQFYGNTHSPRLGEIYNINEEGTAFVYTADKKNQSPFRAYFKTKLAEAPETINIVIKGNKTTDGIVNIVNIMPTNNIYNLQGIKVNENYKGIVIKNGKKVIK